MYNSKLEVIVVCIFVVSLMAGWVGSHCPYMVPSPFVWNSLFPSKWVEVAYRPTTSWWWMMIGIELTTRSWFVWIKWAIKLVIFAQGDLVLDDSQSFTIFRVFLVKFFVYFY